MNFWKGQLCFPLSNNLMFATLLSHSFSKEAFFPPQPVQVSASKLFVTLICAMSPFKEGLQTANLFNCSSLISPDRCSYRVLFEKSHVWGAMKLSMSACRQTDLYAKKTHIWCFFPLLLIRLSLSFFAPVNKYWLVCFSEVTWRPVPSTLDTYQ